MRAAMAWQGRATLAPHPTRRDWYAIPPAWTPEVAPAPAVHLDGRWGPLVHRSHLPLLAKLHPEVENFLSEQGSLLGLKSDRAAFDAATEANGWKLREYQHAGREFIRSRRGTLLADQMRLGKAQSLDAKVLTPRGWRLMGDLHVGDEIVDPDGGVAYVEAIYPQGVKPVYRVKLSDGAATECCDEHLWAVQTADGKHGDRPLQVRSLQSMRDCLWMPTAKRDGGRGNRRFFVPLTQPVQFAVREPLPLDPYLLGALLGDGGLTNNSPMFSCADVEILARVRTALPQRVRAMPAGGVDYRLSTVDGNCAQPNPLSVHLRALELWGCDSFTKFIPLMYLRASIEDRLALLQGLMDTNGDVTEDNVVCFTTTSQQLRDGVLDLVRSLGGFASVGLKRPTYTYQGEKRTGAITYQLHIRMPVNPFHLPRKAARWHVGRLARGIDSVELIGTKPCQCIKVSSKRSLYITDDYIVTHNTAQLVSSHELDDGPLIVVAPLPTREVWLGWFRRRWPDIRPTVLAGKHVAYVDPKTKRSSKRRKDRGYDLLEGAYFNLDMLMNAQLVFMNYDILAGWKNFGNRRVGTLIFDEIHLLSNKKSRRSLAAMFLAGQADRVVGATGTPLWNKPAGLYTTLTSICPGAWGKYHEYAKRYADGRMGPHGFVADGASHEEEFRARMTEVMIRRTWQGVLGQVPPITRTVEVVEITERQAFEVEKEAERVRNHLRKTTVIGATARFRRLLANLKVEGAIDVAKRILDGGDKVIIWTWHRDVALRIEAALAKLDYPGFVVSGSTNMDIREQIFQRWRTHTSPTPLCITLAVGQVGIDLSAARHEVFAELDYTPSIVAQAEMRPFNGVQPISATYVIIDHDIERAILEALQNKCELAFRMGVPAAESAVDVIASGFTGIGGGDLTPDDLSALASAVLADHPEDEGEHDYHGTLWNYDWEVE